MYSYKSRWEELPTNQQGQVMTNFKPGDWVDIPSLNTEPVQYRLDLCHLGLELWQPKPDEWCWFWNDKTDIPRLRQFISASNPFDRPTVYTTHPDPATVMSRTYCGIESYNYCEPFIGDLPQF